MNPMANMNPMGGPVGGAPVPMMNNGNINPQAANAANPGANASAPRQQPSLDQRSIFNTYIYEYYLRYGMYDCARALLASEAPVYVADRDATARRRDENGNAINGAGDDPMDTDSKEDLDSKLPEDLPSPKLPMATSESFLYEWFCIFWDIYTAQRTKGSTGMVSQYVAHTQQQNRLKQNQQQELLRQMRPDLAQQQYQAQLMRSMNNNMPINMKQGNLARAAMANNQNNPQMQMLQQAKQNPMQRDPSGMDANRDRPSSPASGENAPSPSKRQRIDAAQFNPNQPGAMMPNGRPVPAMQGQQMAANTAAAAHQMLTANGINPSSLNAQQFQNFVNMPPAAQQKSIATYSQNLQQHHGSQMGNKTIPNAGAPQNQGSPMMPSQQDGSAIAAFYNAADMGGPGGLRPGPGAAQPGQGGSNHALQDYQMQLMLLEQQNKKRLMMARQEQDNMGGVPREGGGPGGPGGPGAPQGPNGQPFPDASPQAMRTGTSPNPTEQMKRGTPQMNNSGIPSPVPEGGQSRGSPNPAMNFMANHVDPSMAPHFFKGMEGNMAQAQMNGLRAPSSHPGQPFNGQMNPQQMMAARQAQQQGQPGQQPQPGQPQQPGVQGNPQQWQPGPNGQMMPQGMQQNPQVQGTPQQRAMPPPSAPAAAGPNANSRTTASPQQAAAAPPTPNQSNKAGPKKKDTKNAKDKRAAQKKSNPNLNAGATPSGENGDSEAPAPATPITPVNPGNFGKAGQNGPTAPNGQSAAGGVGAGAAGPVGVPQNGPPQAQIMPPGHGDPNQNGGMNMDGFTGMVDFPGSLDIANPLQTTDVLNDFDFDSFLHDDSGAGEPFDFNGAFATLEGNEISAD
ncbi:hypothetical protein S40285_07292 [Stachybotrys chlorohalonatus IBT 40285]|uniref:Uncharacterized protein n=1 Tax=Stachybotrys chlorohalonatus (strain IBT 40285) TaxID=1283841 RepID=A0A084QT54_STAC4|nr:hypothetical protein S40285_07292 [Stachybotrys chlorohalonata IBT 40285]